MINFVTSDKMKKKEKKKIYSINWKNVFFPLLYKKTTKSIKLLTVIIIIYIIIIYTLTVKIL